MNSLEISYIGAACGKNKYEPRDKILLLLLCREYKDIYKNIFFENGTFVLIKQDEKTYDKELKKIYSEYKKDISNPDEFNKVKEEIKDKLKSENKDLSDKDLKHAADFLDNSLKKDCGTNNEQKIIKKMKYQKGNNRMYYYSENNWTIKGFHDATDNDVVIEIKTRMRQNNVRKNEYDLYQLFGYMLSMGKTKGKIVQKFNKSIYDSDTESDKEYGVVDISIPKWKEKFETFKEELNEFFEEIKEYKNKTFDTESVIRNEEKPIACFDIDGLPHNVNPKFEKIVNTLI